MIVLSTNPGLYTVWWTQWYYTWSARLRIFIQLMHRQTRFDFSPVFYLAHEGHFYAVIIQNHLKWDTCKCSNFCLKVYIYRYTACLLNICLHVNIHVHVHSPITYTYIAPPPSLSLWSMNITVIVNRWPLHLYFLKLYNVHTRLKINCRVIISVPIISVV